MRYLAPLLCLALLTGCTSDLKALKELNPAADDFPGALAAEYRDFADSEAEQGHKASAEHFASKGIRAYHGIEVGPDAVDSSITGPQGTELSAARAQLSRLLTPEVKKAAPKELARAQLVFDCWQQQIVAGLSEDKALCAAEFAPALSQLLEQAGPEVYDQAFRRSISFAPNSTALTEENKADISDVVCQLADMGKDYWVELRAYVGRKSSQRKLTEARISNVRRMLIKDGVHPHQIRVHREGAKRAVMLSRDNIPMNTKVVTITITAEPHGKARKAK